MANLKLVTMRGVKSAAMLLTAINGPTIELVDPPANAEVGDRLDFEGWQNCIPNVTLNPEKKLWERLEVSLSTNSDRGVVVFPNRISANIKPSFFNGCSSSRLVGKNSSSCSVKISESAVVR